jgi:hypothetical protein
MSWLWLIDEHPKRVEQAFELKQSARDFVKWLGEKCDLIPFESW